MLERLDKFIATQKGMPRSEARKLIVWGRVEVNGAITKKPDFKIDPSISEIKLNGESLQYKKYVYIMLNKPAGVLSAASDKNRQTVVDLVPQELRRRDLFPVGRLDKDTTGLLLITDDGDFAHKVISPKYGLDKRYIAELDGEVTEGMVEAFKNGVTLADGTECMPANLEFDKSTPTRATITVKEGKYHQIKRMFGVVGLGVNSLHRESLGCVVLDKSLAPGECKELNDAELYKLLSLLQKNQ